MSRIIVVLLLILGLFACPLRCLSCQTRSAVEEQVVELQTTDVRCSCCAHVSLADSLNQNGEPSPGELPVEDCSCPDCLCDGATIPGFDESPDDPTVALSFLSNTTDHSPPISPSVTKRLRCLDRPPALFVGGAARIAFQRWLI